MRLVLYWGSLALLLLSGCARSQASPASLAAVPESADGSTILQRSCAVCHNLGGLGAYADSWGEPEWRSMVETMISYGAMVTPAELDILAEYLAVNFGTGLGADDTEMVALLDSACASCHGLDILNTNTSGFDAGQFRDTVVRMIQYGSPVSQDQVEPLVTYLLETYGD